jgi:hypothetical protein
MLRNTLRQVGAAVAVIALAIGPTPSVTAQGTLGGPRTSAPAPRLIADCDITVQSCGGDPTLEGSNTPSLGSSTPQCGNGTKGLCNQTTVMTCTSWRITTVNGSATVEDLKGVQLQVGTTISCQTWDTKIYYYYWI